MLKVVEVIGAAGGEVATNHAASDGENKLNPPECSRPRNEAGNEQAKIAAGNGLHRISDDVSPFFAGTESGRSQSKSI